jgi:hypothetical protein
MWPGILRFHSRTLSDRLSLTMTCVVYLCFFALLDLAILSFSAGSLPRNGVFVWHVGTFARLTQAFRSFLLLAFAVEGVKYIGSSAFVVLLLSSMQNPLTK